MAKEKLSRTPRLDGLAYRIIQSKRYQILKIIIFIRNIWESTLIGFESGALLMFGGFDRPSMTQIKDIWRLKNGSWSIKGSLKEVLGVVQESISKLDF